MSSINTYDLFSFKCIYPAPPLFQGTNDNFEGGRYNVERSHHPPDSVVEFGICIKIVAFQDMWAIYDALTVKEQKVIPMRLCTHVGNVLKITAITSVFMNETYL